MRTLLLLLMTAAPLAGQRAPLGGQSRDFLTADEVDQIREAQDPNERVALYSRFARTRIDLVKSLLSKDKAGRSVMIHDALDDFAKIVDAIDDVTDQALARHADMKKGMISVSNMERESLASLRRIRDTRPKDLERYEFVLKTAIETASDSMELADGDLDRRGRDAEARDDREKQAVKDSMSPAEKAEAQKEEQKAEAQKEQQRKAPTLMRPGEKKQDKQN
jgi:hypothetical protein